MRSAIAVLLLAGAVLACGESLTPLPETTWRTAPIPSGSSLVLLVSVSNGRATGSGSEYGLMGALKGQVAISGTWTRSTFTLVLTPTSGAVQPATYTGGVASTSELQGTWIEGGDSTTVAFYKQ